MTNLYDHRFHLLVVDPLEEPFHLVLVFTYLTFSLTKDNGTYYFPTRDFHPPSENYHGKREQLENFLEAHKKRIRKLSDKRLYIPKETPRWTLIIHGLQIMRLYIFFQLHI